MPMDVELLTLKNLALLEGTGPGVFDDPVDRRAAAQFLADPRHHLVVALVDGVIAGFASAVHYVHPDDPRPELWINEVAVVDLHRRRGVGRALIDAMLARGRALGCSEAWVLTERRNVAARRFYSTCGGEATDDTVLFTFPLAAAPSTVGAGTAGADGPQPPLRLRIRAATPADAESWLRLRRALWPEGAEAEHRAEIEDYFTGRATEPQEVLLAADHAGGPLGVAELSLRPCAEGCTTSPVAYLEGWYVMPRARRRGVGRRLLLAAEEWGRRQGCREIASDTAPDNDVSAVAHLAAGFDDAGLVRCFRKSLTAGGQAESRRPR